MTEPGRSDDKATMQAALASLVRRCCSGAPSRSEVDSLILSAVRMVERRLGGKLSAVANREGVPVRGLATSAVAELFSPGCPDSPLCQAMREYLGDDAALASRFLGVIQSRVDQFLFHRLESTDPNGYKITRNLRIACREDPRVAVWPADNPRWISLVGFKDSLEPLAPWPYRELLALVIQAAAGNLTIPDWLVSVLSAIQDTTEYQRFVDIGQLEAAFRHANAELLSQEIGRQSNNEGLLTPHRLALQQAVDVVQVEVLDRLDRLVEIGRIDSDTRCRLGSAMTDLLGDFADDGAPSISRFEYVSRHWPGLTPEHYAQHLKSPFQTAAEYVQRRLGEILAHKLL